MEPEEETDWILPLGKVVQSTSNQKYVVLGYTIANNAYTGTQYAAYTCRKYRSGETSLFSTPYANRYFTVIEE